MEVHKPALGMHPRWPHSSTRPWLPYFLLGGITAPNKGSCHTRGLHRSTTRGCHRNSTAPPHQRAPPLHHQGVPLQFHHASTLEGSTTPPSRGHHCSYTAPPHQRAPPLHHPGGATTTTLHLHTRGLHRSTIQGAPPQLHCSSTLEGSTTPPSRGCHCSYTAPPH